MCVYDCMYFVEAHGVLTAATADRSSSMLHRRNLPLQLSSEAGRSVILAGCDRGELCQQIAANKGNNRGKEYRKHLLLLQTGMFLTDIVSISLSRNIFNGAEQGTRNQWCPMPSPVTLAAHSHRNRLSNRCKK